MVLHEMELTCNFRFTYFWHIPYSTTGNSRRCLFKQLYEVHAVCAVFVIYTICFNIKYIHLVSAHQYSSSFLQSKLARDVFMTGFEFHSGVVRR